MIDSLKSFKSLNISKYVFEFQIIVSIIIFISFYFYNQLGNH